MHVYEFPSDAAISAEAVARDAMDENPVNSVLSSYS
jgi:hypothetical protein